MLEISRVLTVPEEVYDAIIELNPEYFITRCPDAANGVPAEMYTDRISQMYKHWKSPKSLEIFCYTLKEFERKKSQLCIVKKAVETGLTIH